MRKTFFLFSVLLLQLITAKSQTQFKVYHGLSGETQVYDFSGREIYKPVIRMKQGERFSVKVVNPNPLLYNYALKLETLVIESDDKGVSDVLTSLGTIISGRVSVSGFAPKAAETSIYKDTINKLIEDINNAKRFITESDRPELPDDALRFNRTGGFRLALDRINALPATKYRFNNTSILADLNTLSDNAAVDDVEKEAFRLLNSSLVGKVKEIKKQTDLQSIQTVWQKEFKVSDSAQKITLVISRIDNSINSMLRDGNTREFELEVGTVIPYFKRSVLELIPVANFVFTKGAREFYLDNNLVQSRTRTTTATNAGMILNVNITRFGESKEMSVGVGPGYKFNSKGDAFENLYLSTLFSYKNYLRFGVGFGFSQVPGEELKNGVKTGQALPQNIANLNDLIQYEEKPSVFLTISFTGLNLTKKN